MWEDPEFTLPVETDESTQQLFYKTFSRRYNDGSIRPSEVIETIHEELLGHTYNKSDQDKLDDLLQIAEMTSTLAGTEIQFPPFEINGELLSVTGEYTQGVYEGAIDLSFAIKKPQIFGEGIFIQPDSRGNTMSSLIGDTIPVWKMRVTPFREKAGFSINEGSKAPSKVALISATQRFIGLDEFPISKYKRIPIRFGEFEHGWNMHKIFDWCLNKYAHLPSMIGQNEIYIFGGIPGNYILNQMEDSLNMKSHEIFTLLGIAALQSAGFHTIRCVSDYTQPSLAGHRAKGHTEQASFNYDELCNQYFEWDPRLIVLGHNAYADKDRYPWLLEHAGNQLGVKNGQSAMSPEFIRYLSQTGYPSSN